MSKGLLIVGEDICAEVVSSADAFTAVEAVFGAMAKGDAYNFPVIREAIGYADALYGFKSGFDKAGKTLGVKSGGYWPGNMDKGLTNHQSTIFLFDPDTGMLEALVGGNYLTAVRTAASSSVSIAHLARKDAKVLGMVGAGHQSTFQLRAAAEQRDFEKVVAWNPHPDMLPRLGAVAEELGLAFEAVTQEELGAQADVIITITSAFEPLLMKDWIKPGTHIACMGTDTKGKQEVDPELLVSATVFADEIAQSVTIGEAQHAVASGRLSDAEITPIGAVINGTHAGRSSDQQITLFDGTGVGLQDLAVASVAAREAESRGKATRIAL
ncbi:ornithine cyclodeaminase family protein [Roseobacter denitrificans]|uniref:Ornithine cyclodeaminase/mu-crystallin family protein n=1 Tax=Roseobacter denitrificans (strain ATCC 33942 / OCh 114) TaxID=375451 RepID=Q165D0_ROSDO|nr:iminosuccinate reductase BhcD [Roseobacter denitrificans]ABG32413.1 ornithine cyclodeaminase/mu-crystallin family protein [Roseobacter denitrificans OCh 114]AVL51881.1 ornithine cyclodeaminase family protein [Roseobacter denitrificans]SFF81468.1 ornithine cyclodeaminase [Roseobacter denitrificans OCh 114]